MPTDPEYRSRPWSITFRIAGHPRCPGCCEKLTGDVISFHEGWAWCPVCSSQALHAQTHLRFVMSHGVMMRSAVISHGLRFYLPGKVDGNYLNAIDEYERLINNPAEAPAAIAAWPSFSLAQLPQAVSDRDFKPLPPWRRDVVVPDGYEIAGVADDGRTVLVEIQSDSAPNE